MNLSSTVVLIGMMGSGKSAVGRELSELLGCGFADSDALIESQQQATITKIFAELGEATFRHMEYDVIKQDVTAPPPHVLAVGGGAFIEKDTRAFIKSNATTLWLKADLDVILARLEGDDTRPLLQGVDKQKKLKELMDNRYPIYAEADFTVENNQDSAREVAEKIVTLLRDNHD